MVWLLICAAPMRLPQALAWMVHRENSNCLPPFWEPRVVRPGAALTYVSQVGRGPARQEGTGSRACTHS